MALYRRGKTGIYWARFTVAGRETRCSLGTSDRKKAAELERKLKSQADDDAHRMKTGRSLDRTFGEAVLKWVESGDYPESMASHIWLVHKRLEKVQLVDVPVEAEEMRAELLSQDLSPLTVNRRLAVVRRVLKLAHKRWRWLADDISSRIELMSEKGSAREVFLSDEQVDTLLAAVERDDIRDFLFVAAYTGARRGELLRLRREHLRPGALLLTADITKSSKPRLIPLLGEVEEVLRRRVPWGINGDELTYAFRKARATVGMDHVRLHDLRHSFASRLAENPEVPLTVLRDLLGHSSLSVTNRYTHLRAGGAARAAVDALRKQDRTTSQGGECDVVTEEVEGLYAPAVV